jgi:hypothetical protein
LEVFIFTGDEGDLKEILPAPVVLFLFHNTVVFNLA